MNTLKKLGILADAGKYDICASNSTTRKPKGDNRVGKPTQVGVCTANTPSGCVNLLKVLYTNACTHDCKYCPNSGCEKRTVSFEPGELAGLFMKFFVRNYVEGLFLSSGVAGDSNKVMEKMVETVRILREKEKFQGYVHMKILPGTSYELVKQSSEIADRLSINVEAPNKSRFSDLTSTKDYKIDILRRIMWLKNMNLPAGFTTQYVVGAAGETDKEIIDMTNWLYEKAELKRAYYSAFIPVKNTPLEKGKQTPLIRENMLYRTDWLIRKYGYKKNEVLNALDNEGFLSFKKDPKTTIAEKTLKPIDLNQDSYDKILRVPGIGVTGAKRIIHLRESGLQINNLNDLKRIGSASRRAVPFVKIRGEMQSRLKAWSG